ncbi:HalOD1 output domain-containing protein [Halorussus caseinilyticus]|uniref:HalOD1 output domain-containing protein n=1 Tax=Halorussus caseinilyticus TaxID=3034025 RepID=UPI0023E761B8|nr:HalOD1 output domain-containing protein [Halorussus sp. DT72]
MTNDTTVLPSGVEIERDESDGCYRARYDSTEHPTSTVVVTAVAAVTETDPLDLEPLRESLDPDALDDIFRRTPGGHVREEGCVEFSLAAHEVVVGAEGDVEIYPPA